MICRRDTVNRGNLRDDTAIWCDHPRSLPKHGAKRQSKANDQSWYRTPNLHRRNRSQGRTGCLPNRLPCLARMEWACLLHAMINKSWSSSALASYVKVWSLVLRSDFRNRECGCSTLPRKRGGLRYNSFSSWKLSLSNIRANGCTWGLSPVSSQGTPWSQKYIYPHTYTNRRST